MKKLLIMALMLVSGTVTFAQNTKKPVFEKKGDLVKATYYHENGEVAQTGHFTSKGKLQGEWTSFDVNGKKTAIGTYENGKKVGKWFFWKGDSLQEVDYATSKNAKRKKTSVVSN